MLTERKWRESTVPYLLVGLFGSVCLGALAMQMLGLSEPGLKEGDPGFHLPQLVEPGFAEKDRRFWLLVANAIFVHGFLLAMMLVFLRVNRIGLAEAFGLRSSQWWRVLAITCGAFVVVLPFCWLLGKLSTVLIESLGSEPVAQPAVQFLLAKPPLKEKLFMAFSTIVLAPVVEEMLFRGILYPSVKQAGFPKVALFGIAALFAVYHSNLMIFFPLFVLGIILTLLYEALDNLLAPILLHALFNAANYVVLIMNWDLEALVRRLFNG